ncbi:hypothetical protein, partial [Oharaeibacter diazotrophicus]|uniref:hypothetical protein n=1 Tax=Oharaeibacter diazotrophicus TaxID=1920512 RepID=UPI001A98B745
MRFILAAGWPYVRGRLAALGPRGFDRVAATRPKPTHSRARGVGIEPNTLSAPRNGKNYCFGGDQVTGPPRRTERVRVRRRRIASPSRAIAGRRRTAPAGP